MNTTEVILTFFLAWQISSMPIPSWMATAFFGIDGHTFNETRQFSENHFAVQNKYWAGLIFVLELLKGLAAVSMYHYLPVGLTFGGVDADLFLVFIVLLGNAFPIYSEFAPSKSVGAFFGIALGLALVPAIISLAVFITAWVLFKKVTVKNYLLAILTLVCLTFTNYDVQLLLLTVAIGSASLLLVNKPHRALSV